MLGDEWRIDMAERTWVSGHRYAWLVGASQKALDIVPKRLKLLTSMALGAKGVVEYAPGPLVGPPNGA